MPQFKPFHLAICIFLMFPVFSYGQMKVDDKSFIEQASSNAIDFYNGSRSEKLGVYKGWLYRDYVIDFGHPFFQINEFRPGNITYEGIKYKDVPLLYDLVKEEVIVLHPNGFMKVRLYNDDIKNFSIEESRFINIKEGDKILPAGIYQLIYEGHQTIVLKKNIKIVKDVTSGRFVKKEISEGRKYYISKDGQYFHFKNKRGLIKVLADKKAEVKEFIKDNKRSFKKFPDAAIVQTVGFYDTL